MRPERERRRQEREREKTQTGKKYRVENRRNASVCIVTRGIYQNSRGDATTRLVHWVASDRRWKLKARALRVREKKKRTGKKWIKMCRVPEIVQGIFSAKIPRGLKSRWKKSRWFQKSPETEGEAWKVYQSSSAWKFKIVNELMIATSRNILRCVAPWIVVIYFCVNVIQFKRAASSDNENCVSCTALSALIFYTRYIFAADKLRIVRLDLSNLCIVFDTDMGIEFQRNSHFHTV